MDRAIERERAAYEHLRGLAAEYRMLAVNDSAAAALAVAIEDGSMGIPQHGVVRTYWNLLDTAERYGCRSAVRQVRQRLGTLAPAHTVLERAARAVVSNTERDSVMFEDAQSPAEDWSLDALAAALHGRDADALALIDRYEDASDEVRLSYAGE